MRQIEETDKTRPLGAAVIGTGFWGRNHARIYRELHETKLVAVCDVNRERSEKVAKQFNVKAYTTTKNMLENEGVEAVSVCTWSTDLAKEASKALENGKHVLIEKPMATNVTQAAKLLETARKNGVHLTVGFLMRFIPGIQRIKTAIETKEIGKLVCATAKRVSEWPERRGDIGVVKDLAIHDIDSIRYLFGEDPESVYAKTGRIAHKKFEDYAQIMLTFKQGKSAFIEANWLTPYKTRTLTITGSAAIMKLDYVTQNLTITNAREISQPRYSWQEPLKLEIQHFINCVLKREKPLVSGLDGLKALQVAEAALHSSKLGRAVDLKEG